MQTHGPLALVEVFKSLAGTDNVSYIVSHDLRIIRTNAAWDRFARANEGEALAERGHRGASVVAAISEPLRTFYADGYRATLASGRVWEHDYECSTPTRYRAFRMIAYPFDGGLVVTHSLRLERGHERVPLARSAAYEHEGLVTACSHCRRVKRVEDDRWDWVPAYLRATDCRISHGLCLPCARYYFGDLC